MAGTPVIGSSWFSAGLVMFRLINVTVLDTWPQPSADAVSVACPSAAPVSTETGISAFQELPDTGADTPLTVTGPAQALVPDTFSFSVSSAGARSFGPICAPSI